MRNLIRFLKRLYPVRVFVVVLLFSSVSVLVFSIYNIKYSGKIFPNISVANIGVSGMSSENAVSLLSEKLPLPQKIKLINQTQSFNLNTKDIGFSYNYTISAQKAFNVVRSGNFLNDMYKRIDLFAHPENLTPEIVFDEAKLTKFISVIAGQDSVEPVKASIKKINGSIVVNSGSEGHEVDRELLKKLILTNLSTASSADITIPINIINNTLTKEESEAAKKRAEKILNKNIQIKFEFNTFNLPDTDLLKLLNLKGGYDEKAITNKEAEFATKVERDPQNPKFVFDNGKVTEFKPALDGIKIDKEKFKSLLISILKSLEEGADKTITFNVPVVRTPPEITNEKVNNLGIKELIGRGTSTYFHSIPGRIYNVSLAANRINGTLVKPGETFSFNDTLGDVSAFTGYQQAYIISEGKTILGDGGGVCQVSTTLFRSLLNAGLPITERAAHAYRVGYYEQSSPPGLDATVYGPSPDLKFVNDTPAYILIEATADPVHYSLIFELYGTNDGRVATITKPAVSNISPALPTVYQDDPTLAVGTTKQVDYSAKGAKVSFNYVVKRAGETIHQKTFVSNYRPWAAVYLRGTRP